MKSLIDKLRRWLGLTTAPVLIAKLVGPVTLICTLLTYRNWITETQAAWIVATGLPAGVGALYWLLAQTDAAVVERAVAQAPVKTSEQIIERIPEAAMGAIVKTAPQVALDGVENMAGVRFIVAEKRYADANPNPNVISPLDASARLSQGGMSP